MALADRFANSDARTLPSRSSNITCTRYDPIPGTRRCKHYLEGGPCALPDEFMCVEWLKANGYAKPSVSGQPTVDSPAPAAPTPAAANAAPSMVIRNLSDEDIASFKALGVEVCLTTDFGDLWLVPEYTGRTDRKELSAQDAATLAAVCAAFPGTRITRWEMVSQSGS